MTNQLDRVWPGVFGLAAGGGSCVMESKLGKVVDAREPRRRALELDVLRGASALAVVVLHASSGPLTEEAAVGHASWIMLVPNVTARFAVPVFMMLSGMGLTLSNQRDGSYARFVWRRLSSILPAYIAWSLVYMCLIPKHESLTVRTLASDLVTGHASNHLYFVPALLRLYILYPVMSYFARRFWAVAACCALSWAMIWLSPVLRSTPLGAFVDDVLPLRWIGFFVLGIWLARARAAVAPDGLRLARALAPWVAVTALGCMIAIVRRVTEQSADIEVGLGAAEPLVFAYSVAVLLWALGSHCGDGALVRFLMFVSGRSYTVYLSHMLILHLCALGVQALAAPSTPLMLFFTSVLLGIPLVLATAVLSQRAVRSSKLLYRALAQATRD